LIINKLKFKIWGIEKTLLLFLSSPFFIVIVNIFHNDIKKHFGQQCLKLYEKHQYSNNRVVAKNVQWFKNFLTSILLSNFGMKVPQPTSLKTLNHLSISHFYSTKYHSAFSTTTLNWFSFLLTSFCWVPNFPFLVFFFFCMTNKVSPYSPFQHL